MPRKPKASPAPAPQAPKKPTKGLEDAKVIADVPATPGVTVTKGKGMYATTAQRKVAFPMAGSVTQSTAGNFYSPELSTDFLELPQSIDEQRNFYRFFYDYEPFVGQAIDLHTELPLSKLRIGMPQAKDRALAERAMRFCTKWAKKVHLLQRLMEITHEWNLIGEVYVFVEDTNPEMPRDVKEQAIREITADGEILERWETFPDAQDREAAWLNKNYQGWTAIRCLPPEQVQVESFPFTDEKLVELVIDSKTKSIINQANNGDARAMRVANSLPPDILDAVHEGRNVPLNTDPEAGSFVHVLARKRSPYDARGKSVLGRCLLPGTPIWVLRDTLVQQVSVEQVNDKTDKLLTHKGRFMPCIAGSRPVDETVLHLSMAGVQNPLKLTSDHEVLRLTKAGVQEWVPAGQLKVGDLVCETHVAPQGTPIQEVDLAQWWDGRQVTVAKRGRLKLGLAETNRVLQVTQSVCHEGTLNVTFQYDNDNRNRALSSLGLSKLLAWAATLTEPVIRSQHEVALEAGVSDRDVRVYAPRLRKEGLLRIDVKSLGRGHGYQATWHPATACLPKIQISRTSPIGKIQISEDFCYLLGTWLGDGSVWTETESALNTHSVTWSLHEAELANRVAGLVQTCFPNSPVERGALYGTTTDTNQDLRIEDPLLACWFQTEFGHGAYGKHLPEWLFHLSDNLVWAVLRGLLDTDGWVHKGKNSSRIEITSASKILLDQVHLLCNRLGVKTQVETTVKKAFSWERSWVTKNGVSTKTYSYPEKSYHSLSCSQHFDVLRWLDGTIKGAKTCLRQPHHQWGNSFQNGYLTRKVQQIEEVSYAGNVHSFSVLEDESHVTGDIVTHNCLRTLILRDKVRQSLTQIASRHMTPYRLIYAEDMSDEQTDALRDQVELALQDPDYSIVTNYQVNWEEMGADQRLPDWSWVFELTDRQMYAGLGVTESLLSGESSYSGDRIHLEVINTRFMLLREMLQDLVEEYFFKPMCARMGFVEDDEDGNLTVITPKLSFTRLALRDTQDTYDALFNLYQKGSIPVDVILDLLNIDPISAADGLKKDLGTLNDATMNEVLRGAYSEVGRALAENSDITDIIAKNLGLKYAKPKEDAGRF